MILSENPIIVKGVKPIHFSKRTPVNPPIGELVYVSFDGEKAYRAIYKGVSEHKGDGG